jgi:succinate dehydrogenase / fumarate reductase, cytochrome b subunit
MALDRKVGFFEGLRYKGGGPMLAWILHRISGLGMIVFVSLHVAASFFTQEMGSDWAISINIVYESVFFQLFIYFSVLFHALNGMRIIILDLWPRMIRYQREMTWLQWLIFVPIYGLTIFIMLQRFFTGG